MPRTARLVLPGCPHPIVQRGNNRRQVFFVDEDRRYYLKRLRRQAERFGLAVQAYCLMTNHLHLIATPRAQDSPAKGVGRTNLYSTRYVNGLHGRSGHLRQDRFFSGSLDEEWFRNVLIYVERKALRAKLVRKAKRGQAPFFGRGRGLPLASCPGLDKVMSCPGHPGPRQAESSRTC